jgi:hypothetical protein
MYVPLRVVPEHVRRSYLRTCVRVHIDGMLREASDLVAELGETLHVVTAANPGGQILSAGENLALHGRLLRALGQITQRVYVAVAASPDGKWSELSWLVAGLSRRQARRVGTDFQQDAIFELRTEQQLVVGCEIDWVRARRYDEDVPPPDGEDLRCAVRAALGVAITGDDAALQAGGWAYDGDLELSCARCGGKLHLFGVDDQLSDGRTHRASAFVCEEEALVLPPEDVSQAVRNVGDRWRDWLQVTADVVEAHVCGEAISTYVIELDLISDGLPQLYVGETAHPPEYRFAQHKAGTMANVLVQLHGVRLRPDLNMGGLPSRHRQQSRAREAWLAAHLRARGYRVEGGH